MSTNLLTQTSHRRSPSIRFANSHNVPKCINPDPHYFPSLVESGFDGSGLTITATWEQGRAGVYGCSPVVAHFTIDPEKWNVSTTAKKIDSLLGFDEVAKLSPEMVSGLVASLGEHFHGQREIADDEVEVDIIEVDASRIAHAIRRNVPEVLDSRGNGVLAPCVAPLVNDHSEVAVSIGR